MRNESDYIERMLAGYRQPAKVLAVTSGKGGVGKSNIAANIAVSLAASRKKVLLLDADMSLGNIDLLMGVNNRYNISHVLTGRRNLDEIIQSGPGNVEIICGASGLEELAQINEFQRQRLLNELIRLQQENDAIVIDTGAGISKLVVGFCLAADQVLVVTTPEPPAITDAYAMVKLLVGHQYAGRISIVVNMAETPADGKRAYRQIADVAMRFLNTEVCCAGILVRDARLGQAVRLRRPVVLAYPKSQISACLLAMTARLSNGLDVRPQEGGFFSKVVDWFR